MDDFFEKTHERTRKLKKRTKSKALLKKIKDNIQQ